MPKMTRAQTWDRFRKTGMLFLVNQFLHIFGWSLVIEIDNKTRKITNCFPARVKFRGFNHHVQDQGYKKASRYLEKNATALRKEAEL